MKVYIAGPMTGLPDYNYPAFHAAAKELRKRGYEVLNPAEHFDGDQSLPYEVYMKAAAEDVLAAEAIALLKGWEKSAGARKELLIAQMRGLPVYDADTMAPIVVGQIGTRVTEENYVAPHRYRGILSDEAQGIVPMRTIKPSAMEPSVPREVLRAAARAVGSEKPTNPKDAIGSDKLPLHLWPETATVLGCLGCLDGMLKYGRSNFRAIGVRSTIYIDAAKRHLNNWLEGRDNDIDSGLPELGHALACIAIVVDAQAAGKLNDDRNVRGGYHKLVEEMTPHVARLKALHAGESPKHYTIADNDEVGA